MELNPPPVVQMVPSDTDTAASPTPGVLARAGARLEGIVELTVDKYIQVVV